MTILAASADKKTRDGELLWSGEVDRWTQKDVSGLEGRSPRKPRTRRGGPLMPPEEVRILE